MTSLVEKITLWIDKLVSLIILLVMLRMILYMLTSLLMVFQEMLTGNMWLYGHNEEILDWFIFFIVMVKAYKVLVAYMKYQHISICYITELVIISSFLAFIFEKDISEQFRMVAGAIGLVCLIVYVYFYQIFKNMDEQHK